MDAALSHLADRIPVHRPGAPYSKQALVAGRVDVGRHADPRTRLVLPDRQRRRLRLAWNPLHMVDGGFRCPNISSQLRTLRSAALAAGLALPTR